MPSALARPAVDVEGAIRSLLRALNVTGIGTRWYFGAPEQPVFFLGIVQPPTVIPVPGGIVPVYQATCQLDLWGAQARDRYNLSAVATELHTALDGVPSGTPAGAGAVCLGATVTSGARWRPDASDGKAGFVLTSELAFRKA